MNQFPEPKIAVPSVSSKQMAEVDRVMEEDLGISLVQTPEPDSIGAIASRRRF